MILLLYNNIISNCLQNPVIILLIYNILPCKQSITCKLKFDLVKEVYNVLLPCGKNK